MTDRHRVYTKGKKTLKRMMKLSHQGQVVTLAMMISGIVLSRNAQLSMMSSEIPSERKEKSIEMRMRRWVKDTIDVEAVYMGNVPICFSGKDQDFRFSKDCSRSVYRVSAV